MSGCKYPEIRVPDAHIVQVRDSKRGFKTVLPINSIGELAAIPSQGEIIVITTASARETVEVTQITETNITVGLSVA